MAPRDNVQAVLSRVGKQEWFFQRLLGETLEWPVGADRDVDDLSHGRLKTFARPILNVKLSRAASGRVSHSLTASLGESLPWNSRILKLWWHVAAWLAFLRTVLRGLVASRRKAAGLPSWKREHLLFICTHGWEHFRYGPRCHRP